MVPQYLYKYRCWSDKYKYHKRLLTHNALFFASARRFNDPFEFSVAPRNNSAVPESESFRHQHQEMMYNDFGICSLVVDRGSILMWSHYANGHQGFCVGFNHSKLLELFDRHAEDDRLIDDHPIEYCVDYPIVNPHDLDDVALAQRLLTIKSSDWGYEKEHRLILVGETDKEIILDDGTIAEVILGCRMPPEHKDEIIGVLRQRATRIRLFQAREKREIRFRFSGN